MICLGFAIVCLIVIAILTIIAYACCVMAYKADVKADAMYERWKQNNISAKLTYDKGYKDGMFAKECDRDGDCYGCKFDQTPKDSIRCEGCCRNYADGYVKGDDISETKATDSRH